MNIESIYTQQTHKTAQNSALRKAAVAPKPPALSNDESAMINNKFKGSKFVDSYTSQGKIQKSEFLTRGLNIDRRI